MATTACVPLQCVASLSLSPDIQKSEAVRHLSWDAAVVPRHNENRTLEFVGSTQTEEASRQLVKSKAVEPSERFAVYSVVKSAICHPAG
jgi:hypothetical protein